MIGVPNVQEAHVRLWEIAGTIMAKVTVYHSGLDEKSLLNGHCKDGKLQITYVYGSLQ